VSREIKRHKFGVAVIVAIVAALVSGFGYGVYRFLDKQQPVRTTANMQTQRLTGDGKTRDSEISPDGKFLAYIRTEGGERSIWIKQIQTNSNIQIVKPGKLDRFGGLVFSPDGNFLYFNAGTETEDAPLGLSCPDPRRDTYEVPIGMRIRRPVFTRRTTGGVRTFQLRGERDSSVRRKRRRFELNER
jgi:hypothetical protein